MDLPVYLKQKLKQSKEHEHKAKEIEKHWSRGRTMRKLKEIESEFQLTRAALRDLDHNASDRVKFDMFVRFQSVYNQKLRYNEYLRELHVHHQSEEKSLQPPEVEEFFTAFRQPTPFEKLANQQHNNGEFHQAISSYSRELLRLINWLKDTQKYQRRNGPCLFGAVIHKQMSHILHRRALCFLEIDKNEECLIDINQAIGHHMKCRVRDLHNEWHKTALYSRATAWLKVGNSANAIDDLVCAATMKPHTNETTYNDTIEKLANAGINIHPSPEAMKQCNTFLLKLNRISKDGWIELHSTGKSLPKRQGHVMIEHNSYIYVFGGACVEYGFERILSAQENRMADRLRFFRINILDRKTYSFEALSFPNKMKQCLLGYDKGNAKHQSWNRMVTGTKWRNNLIVFGGYNKPFQNVLMYNLDAKVWKSLNIRKMPNFLKQSQQITNHSAVIMHDIMYVFGGEWDGQQTDLFCGLNLMTKKWDTTVAKYQKDVESPGSRLDHVMWTDPQVGKRGSVYIGYGNHHDTDKIGIAIPRVDFWRLDVFERKWFVLKRHGNYPVARCESGATQSKDNGVIMFGGYSSMLRRVYADSRDDEGFSYFGDCYEYVPHSQKWMMIQSKIHPSHRACSAVCLVPNRNVLCLYGGYCGGNEADMCVYNDIWILELNRMRKCRNKSLKICEYNKCDSTQNDMKLFKCKGFNIQTRNTCFTFYCSKHCQKRDWLHHHRALCKR
eukprot:118474_1